MGKSEELSAVRPEETQVEDRVEEKEKDEAGWTLKEIVKLSLESAKVELALAVGAVFVSSGTNLAVPKLIGWVVDLVSRGESSTQGRQSVYQAAMVSLGVFSLGALGSVSRVFFLEMSAMKIAARLRQDLYKAILFSKYDSTKLVVDKSAAVSALSKDCEDLSKAICKNLASVYRGCNSAFGGTAMLLYLSPQLTMVTLSFLPLIGTGAVAFSRFSRKQARAYKEKTEDAIHRAGERVENLKTVKLFQNETFEFENFGQELDDLRSAARKAAVSEGVFMGSLSFALNSSLLTVVLYGGGLVQAGALTAGELASFGLYSGFVGLGFSLLSTCHADMKKTLSANQRVKEILLRASEQDQKDDNDRDELVAAQKISGPIRFDKVCFSYREEKAVLSELSMDLKPGRVIALAGMSGEGKTTTINLLCRLVGSSTRGITWGGVDLWDIPARTFRSLISVVDQTPALFSGVSVMDNIRYSKRDATAEQVYHAAKLAGAADFIEELPSGFDTVLGSEEQAQLSVGQIQRIALARAFLRREQVQLLCFDESTSALDVQSEQKILSALRELAREGKIVFVVAHRTTTLQAADEILILQGGKIADKGTYQELLARDGLFAEVLASDTISNN